MVLDASKSQSTSKPALRINIDTDLGRFSNYFNLRKWNFSAQKLSCGNEWQWKRKKEKLGRRLVVEGRETTQKSLHPWLSTRIILCATEHLENWQVSLVIQSGKEDESNI